VKIFVSSSEVHYNAGPALLVSGHQLINSTCKLRMQKASEIVTSRLIVMSYIASTRDMFIIRMGYIHTISSSLCNAGAFIGG